MSKLKKFSKTNKKRNITVVSAFLIVGLLIVGISYAVYQKEDEVLFINAKVGEFETSGSDIELAMTLDGEGIDTPPNKGDGFYNIAVECDHAIGRWDEEEWGAIITNISSNRVKCNVNFETLDVLANKVELGDYISMTPTSTSYTISTSLTGYTSNQTINPSELNLWRVIRKNEDGTVDVVSEYVSSKSIYFYGQAGYMNLVGGLNTIAAQYTNEKYVSKTRHMGYSNQTEKCSPYSSSSCRDDDGYLTDIKLINVAFGVVEDCAVACPSLKASNIGGTLSEYWLASRGYRIDYQGRVISEDGEISRHRLIYSSNGADDFVSSKVRPILTLKSTDMIISGDGKSAETAYQLL